MYQTDKKLNKRHSSLLNTDHSDKESSSFGTKSEGSIDYHYLLIKSLPRSFSEYRVKKKILNNKEYMKYIKIDNSRNVYIQFQTKEEVQQILDQYKGNQYGKPNLSYVNKLPLDLNAASNIILVTLYQETIDINVTRMFEIFKEFGDINKIVIFKKKNYQVFFEFENVEDALALKQKLHNKKLKDYFYLKIQFTKKKKLKVRQNCQSEFDFKRQQFFTYNNLSICKEVSQFQQITSCQEFDEQAFCNYYGIQIENMPEDINHGNLFNLFSIYGNISSIVIEKDKQIGKIYYKSNKSQIDAFKHIEDIIFFDRIIQLKKIFTDEIKISNNAKQISYENKTPNKNSNQKKGMEPNNILYVYNLNQNITLDVLKNLFSSFETPNMVKELTGKTGLVYFDTINQAIKVLCIFKNMKIMNKTLKIAFAEQQTQADNFTHLQQKCFTTQNFNYVEELFQKEQIEQNDIDIFSFRTQYELFQLNLKYYFNKMNIRQILSKRKKTLISIISIFLLYKTGLIQKILSRLVIMILNRYQKQLNKKMEQIENDQLQKKELQQLEQNLKNFILQNNLDKINNDLQIIYSTKQLEQNYQDSNDRLQKIDLFSQIIKKNFQKLFYVFYIQPIYELKACCVYIQQKKLQEKQYLGSESSDSMDNSKDQKTTHQICFELDENLKQVIQQTIEYIFENQVDEFLQKITYKGAMTLQSFCQNLQNQILLIFTMQEQIIQKISQNLQLQKEKKTLYNFFEKIKYGFNQTQIVSLFFQNSKNNNDVFNQTLSSEYFLNLYYSSIQNNFHKLANRLFLLYKQNFTELKIFEEKAKIKLAQLSIHIKQILEEEFLDEKVVKLQQENYIKRIKLGLYVLKSNQQLENQEQKNLENVDLNCTIVNQLNPFEKSTQILSYIHLQEVLYQKKNDIYWKLLLKNFLIN